MPSSDHYSSEDQFADGVPGTAERVVLVREPNTEANAAISGNNFENDIECGEGDGILLEVS